MLQFHTARPSLILWIADPLLRTMMPKVILHTATSVDGRITGFPADPGLYYGLAAQWNPDAVLFGSGTVLAAVRADPTLGVPPEHEEMFTPPPDTENDPRPLLVIADSRGQVRCWDAIRKWPYMRDVLALCSTTTPGEYADYLKERRIGSIVAGDDRIDMRAALEALNREYGVKVLRVDSGGTLNSVLLHAGVVSEVSVLIHAVIAGGKAEPTLSDPIRAGIAELQVPLRLQSVKEVGNGIVWFRYSVQG
jgi:2,5-diamino-6-(ribosylamino)-4(3H)-pyrimidinone 5'-phosphate reductase